MIKFLQFYNINSRSFKDRVGIWVTDFENKTFFKEEKIGAIGLRLRKWITYHGLSFNINNNLIYYDLIHACGLKNFKNTSMKNLGIKISNEEFDNKFIKIFLNELEKM